MITVIPTVCNYIFCIALFYAVEITRIYWIKKEIKMNADETKESAPGTETRRHRADDWHTEHAKKEINAGAQHNQFKPFKVKIIWACVWQSSRISKRCTWLHTHLSIRMHCTPTFIHYDFDETLFLCVCICIDSWALQTNANLWVIKMLL